MALQLWSTICAKAVGSLTDYVLGGQREETTDEESVVACRRVSMRKQVVAAVSAATAIGSWGNCTLFVGSAYNATVHQHKFDYFVNCAHEMPHLTPPDKTFRIPLKTKARGENTCVLSARIIQNARDRLLSVGRGLRWWERRDDAAAATATPLRVLVYCYTGCCRAPAVAMLLAASLAHNFASMEDWHNLFIWRRPATCISPRLFAAAESVLRELGVQAAMFGSVWAESVWPEEQGRCVEPRTLLLCDR